MLDTDTKRRIDTARDILVGKVPDPKSQVEQITIALIYKFMDDMDAESEELGGKRKFFTGDFARYGWAKLMTPALGGHEMLGLYAEGITKMPENPGIPPLFRDIFKNAYLPYRDPETLKAFLKIIDEFNYDHSERLGDAFEYLLSVLGSQGDAGQFRTPRHIIDFIVDIIDPKKTDTILDPACGTAGFLISSYKHILKANVDPEGRSTLTPDEKGRLAQNFKGYDISPDMVRLSLVNMYLHGFTDPHIYEYDTLTSDERWNEFADVILANPPFMSPKGGIKPHKRFSIQAKRSEVLFVDYMAEHLAPSGRAGIIVPEGVIFQNQTAYKDLRKMLVENALVAVVSLPAGCFNPYSGVKTSILFLDRSLAKQSDTIAFFKVENDGFGLGAQRRAFEKNDLPQVKAELQAFLQALGKHQPAADLQPTFGLMVPKEKIAADGEYDLSGRRYLDRETNTGLKWPLVSIGELCVVERGASPRPIHDFMTDSPDGVNWIKIGDAEVGAKYITSTKERITPDGAAKSRRVKPGDFILSNSMSFGRPYVMATDGCIHDGWLLLRDQSSRLNQDFLYHILGSKPVFAQFERSATGGVVNNLNSELVRNVRIPLPPLDVQTEIVTEIEDYQKVIDGARAVLDNYNPHIPIHSEWPVIELGEICSFKNGLNFTKGSSGHAVKIIGVSNFQNNLYAPLRDLDEVVLDVPLTDDYLVKDGDILFVRSNGNPELVGRSVIVPPTMEPITFSGFTIRARIEDERALPLFYAHFFKSRDFAEMIKTVGRGANIRNLSQGILTELKIPLPPLATQKGVVAEIEREQALVGANRDLVAHFENKIQSVLIRVWGDEEPVAAEA